MAESAEAAKAAAAAIKVSWEPLPVLGDIDAALNTDVLLHPDFGYWVSLSQTFRERAIDAGYRATMAAAPRIRSPRTAQ